MSAMLPCRTAAFGRSAAGHCLSAAIRVSIRFGQIGVEATMAVKPIPDNPFGHIWHISTHVEDVSPQEIGRRAAAMAKGQPA